MTSTNQMPQQFIAVLTNLGYTKSEFTHIDYYSKRIVKDNYLDNVKHVVTYNDITNKYRVYCFITSNIESGEYIYNTGEITIDKVKDLQVLLRLLTQY